MGAFEELVKSFRGKELEPILSEREQEERLLEAERRAAEVQAKFDLQAARFNDLSRTVLGLLVRANPPTEHKVLPIYAANQLHEVSRPRWGGSMGSGYSQGALRRAAMRAERHIESHSITAWDMRSEVVVESHDEESGTTRFNKRLFAGEDMVIYYREPTEPYTGVPAEATSPQRIEELERALAITVNVYGLPLPPHNQDT